MRQLWLNDRTAASNTSAGPFFAAFAASYLAMHSGDSWTDVVGFGVLEGFGDLVGVALVEGFAGGIISERYFAQNASVSRPLARIAASQASFVLLAARA